jgi:anti-sigma factor RsiW
MRALISRTAACSAPPILLYSKRIALVRCIMTVSPDILHAFIEGELSPEEAGRVASAIAQDPELVAYVEDQKALKIALALPLVRWLRHVWSERARAQSWIPAGATAAGIVLGVLLAASFGIGTLMRSESGTLIAQGELNQILSTQLLAEQDDSVPAAAYVGASFWSKDGTFCRSFTMRGTLRNTLAGLACREGRAWRIAAMAAVTRGDDADAKPVAPKMPQMLRDAMQNMIAGDPLSEEAEREARYQGWRAR